MVAPNSTPVLNVRRNEPELVCPARPTPNEVKPVSDLDDIPQFRINISAMLTYPAKEDLNDEKDPAKVIKAALAEALVYYYPWAGRLRDGPGGKLMVDCTAEGVVFVEADADVRLDQFGGDSLLPFPCTDQLLYNEASSETLTVVDSPLFTLQVTRLLCGGFIMGISFSHVMSDSVGVVKFLNTVAELARGASSPSILPVWQRELLNARVTCTLPDEHDQDQDKHNHFHESELLTTKDELVSRTIIFTDLEVAALRACVPQHLQPCTTFELVCACIWLCRTISLQYPPDEVVRMDFAVNFRDKFDPPLPVGYYGNACGNGTCISPAGAICISSFGYVVELVKKAKAAVTEESTRSILDYLVLRGRRIPSMPNRYIMSDVSSSINSFPMLDFGWGKPFYAGTLNNGFPSHCLSFIWAYGNGKGKAVSLSLSEDAMGRFVNAFHSLLKMDPSL